MQKTSSFDIPADVSGMRLDAALAKMDVFPSRSSAEKAISEGLVLLNGAPSIKRQVVYEGDIVDIFAEEQTCERNILDGDIPLDIRFEDDDILVLSKQIGLVCHPDENHTHGTLVDALIAHCGYDHLCNIQGQNDRPGIVHRLDKNTSGLMIVAKTDEAGASLMEAMKDHRIDRRYLALVHGTFAVDSGLIDAPIARSAADRTKMAVRDVASAREASTSFRVLARPSLPTTDYRYSLIECKLNTGRTHQIRVHLEFTKHPLVGETLYRTSAPHAQVAQLGLTRQFLHSYFLCFTHPITHEQLYFCDNIAPDLKDALELTTYDETQVTEYGREVFERLESAPHPSIRGELC